MTAMLLTLSPAALAHPLVYGDPDGGARPQTIEQAIARMELVSRVLEKNSHVRPGLERLPGIDVFNRLYIRTTQNLESAIARGDFEDGAFMRLFAVHFSDYYFEAISRYFSPERHAPRAWQPLFTRNSRQEFRPVQFAFAGLEAHICRDLPIVLALLFTDEAAFPDETSLRHRDFARFENVLAVTFDELQEDLLNGPLWLSLIGQKTALPVIHAFRTKAWKDAEALWLLRDKPIRRRLAIEGLDLLVQGQAQASFLVQF